MQLFVLHFAGGSTYSFDFLKKHLKTDIEFLPLELPGRGKRSTEKLIKAKQEAIEDYLGQILKLRDGSPFIVYGHSMGATLGLSVVSGLEKRGHFPEQLIVSGNSGPGSKKEREIVRYLLNDTEFKEELRYLGGVPEEVLTDEELFDYFAPIIRADFECLEKDTALEKGILITTPIYAIMGTEEETCSEIENWDRFTTSRLKHKILEGNHFFLYNHAEEIAKIVRSSFITRKEPLLDLKIS
ncbi:thioesterase II family protein [Flavobacterium humi]|uniref:Thioesterase n=1 Tax=Flavobacterium humi TaxID=2562683 RepID=A0A4Z0L674_9FLAO|nr:alpha/beta fold hydrolase [Flavobacterium humi]TGD57487.1 thioesterase [Flavobacterium humi]